MRARAVLVLLASLFLTIGGYAQSPSGCPDKARCVSKDLEVVKATLTEPNCVTCMPGENLTASLTLSIYNKTGSTRTAFAFFGTLERTSATGVVTTQSISACNGPIPGKSTYTLPYGPISYKCGETLKVKDLYLAWTDASDTKRNTCASILADCSKIAPKCAVLDELVIETALVATVSASPIACYGGKGTLTVSASGGQGPYQYSLNGGAYQAGNTFAVSAGGPYTVTVKDARGCVAQASPVTVTQPTPLQVAVVSQTNVNCYGQRTGSVTIAGSGGTPPYQYRLGTAGAYGASGTFANLAAGAYTLYVRDAKGCETPLKVTITQPAAALAITATVKDVDCYGGKTGAVNVTVSGGTAPYTYNWADLAGTLDPEDRTGLAAGTYSLTVTDAKGCTISLTSTVKQPAALALAASVKHVDCYGGSTGAIDLRVQGGTQPYTYAWSTTDGLIPEGQAQRQDLSGLRAGSYTVVVTDAKGCTATLTQKVKQPSRLASKIVSQTNVNCYGQRTGSVTVTGAGGTPPYSYRLGTAGAFGTSGTFANLAAGTYIIYVRDAKGCETTKKVVISQPAKPLTLAATVTNVACYGGSTGAIDLMVSGGTGPYTYDWNLDGMEEPDNDLQDLSGLAAGTYTVTVTDAKGCTATLSKTVTQPAAALAVTAAGVAPNCDNLKGGSVSGTITGGTAPYTVSIDNFATSVSSSGVYSFTGLGAGTYTVVVRDAGYSAGNGAGCTASSSPVTLAAPNCMAYEGCTPGYWKQTQHYGSWGCGYDPDDAFFALFPQITDRRGLPATLTLIQALSPELGVARGAWGSLVRHAAAALLNACNPEVNYRYSTAEIIGMVTAAFQAGSPEPTAGMLASANEAGCPLGKDPLAATGSASLQVPGGAEGRLLLTAYPTPFSDKAIIEFTVAQDENYSIRMYDLKGSLVRELRSGTARAGEVTQVEVDGNGLAEGLYIARIVSDTGSGSVKLMLKK